MQERRSSCAVGWLAGWLAGWLWLAMAGYGWVKVVQSWLAERWLAKPVFSNCSQAAHCSFVCVFECCSIPLALYER